MHTTSGLCVPRWSVSCLLQGSEAASGVGEMYSFTIVSLMSCSATMSNISAYILAAEGHGLPTWRSHSVVHILAAGGHGLPTWRSHSVVQLLWLAYNSPRFHFTIKPAAGLDSHRALDIPCRRRRSIQSIMSIVLKVLCVQSWDSPHR